MTAPVVHRAGLVNGDWPLCTEVAARAQGWTLEEVEDGELVDDPLVHGQFELERPWLTAAAVDCSGCLELVHA